MIHGCEGMSRINDHDSILLSLSIITSGTLNDNFFRNSVRKISNLRRLVYHNENVSKFCIAVKLIYSGRNAQTLRVDTN